MRTIFEKSRPGRKGFQVPEADVPPCAPLAVQYLRAQAAPWPELSELEVVRHFTQLARRNYSLDGNFYPLGSCTMKYNPKICDKAAGMSGFANLHPLLPQLRQGEQFVQGALKVLYDTEKYLCEITGMDHFTLQPLAGAHGELAGVMMIAAYHKARGNRKKYMIVPDAAHGTNPASAAIAGYEMISIPSDSAGQMDLGVLKEKINDEVAGLMLTCPNTLGLFNPEIDKIAKMIHAVDGLMYYDGANLNAILGQCRPGDLGFDVLHVNLHKTFATPHGGGGPGSGPVGVKKALEPYLPVSRIVRRSNGRYALDYDYPDTIGYVAPFYGNFAVILRAYLYVVLLGREGLKQASEQAVLNANYLMQRLKPYFDMPYDRACMHEFVLSASRQNKKGVHAIDIAKFLIDQGMHPPTVYFPLSVKEAIMIEPTETEPKEMLDAFIEAMKAAAALSESAGPAAFEGLPRTTPVSRPDEVKAAKDMDVNYFARKGQ